MKNLFCSQIFSKIDLIILTATLCAQVGCKTKTVTPSSAVVSSANVDLKTPVKNDWFVGAVEANPDSLNPILATDIYSQSIIPMMFDTLVMWNAQTGEPQPKLAESWTISPDGLVYTFKLRKNATFHDGTPVTAEDVKFTFDTIKNPKVDAAHLQNYFKDYDSAEVKGPNEIALKMKQVYFRNLIVLGDTAILPKHIYGQGDFNTLAVNRAPVGSGPYQFGKWDGGRVIELKRFDKYWGVTDPIYKDRYNFNKIIFRILTESAVEVMALKKGDIDTIGDVTASQYTTDFADPSIEQRFYKLKFETQDGNGYGYIGWNLGHPMFSTKKTRQALAMLMPRDEINQKIFGGLRTPGVGSFPRNSPKTDPTLKPIPYDVEKAKQLLKEDGWKASTPDGLLERDGVVFRFDLLFTAGVPDNERLALISKDSFRKAGIEMNIKTLEWTVFLKEINDDKFDAMMMGWGSSLDDDPYQIWHSSQAVKGGSNRVKFKNKRADEIMEQARVTLDTKKRNELYQELSRILADEQPYLFTFERPNLTIITKRFQGVLPIGKLGLDSSLWFTPLGNEKYKD